MHYKNGTPAQEGDAVILRRRTGEIAAGTLHSIVPQSDACNATVAIPVPGGVIQETSTIQEMYAAAEAYQAMEALEKLSAAVLEEAPTRRAS